MPNFEYVALNQNGRSTKGSIDAESMRAARQRLRSQGIFPTEIREGMEARKSGSRDIKKFLKSDRVNLRDLSIMTRQLATLLNAGLPLVNALQALTDQLESDTLKRVIVDVREKVEEGLTMNKALANFPKAFPRLYINMVASGEASGKLDAVLTNLADYLEAQLELRRKVSSALMYPALMLVICTLVVTALLVFVVPRIVEIFQKQGAVLPLPTRIMIGISNFIVSYWYLAILLIVGGLYLLAWYYRQPEGRSRIDQLLLKLPLFGPIFIKVSTARVARTLSTLLASGVGLLACLEITRNIIGNVHFTNALEEAKEGVKEGRSLAKELAKSGIFPSMIYHMVAVGEQSGDLEGMLSKAAESYDKDVDATLSGLTRLIEPLMMVFVGGIVLAIVISVLLPMTELIDVVQQ